MIDEGDRVMVAVEQMQRRGREAVKFNLLMLQGLLRDLLLLKSAGAHAPIINVDRADVLAKFLERLQRARLDDMITATEEAMYLVERNVNARLLLATLSRKMALSMLGSRDGKLETSLTG